MKLIKTLLAIAAFSVNVAFASSIVWDQGPATGSYGGSWQNQTAAQNFADYVVFNQDTWVDGLNYFTNYDLSNPNNIFHIKVLADVAGTPGAVLYSWDVSYSSYTANVGLGLNQVSFTTSPILALAGQGFWVGVSGNGFEAAQVSLNTPQDGKMAQFNGSTYSHMAGVGDQAFQLTGSVVPEPEAMAMMVLGLGLIAAARRRK
jgi:hypothetical protein